MKNMISRRVREHDYSNRFSDFYKIESPSFPLLDFGIGEDVSLIGNYEKGLISNILLDQKAFGYSENYESGLKEAFISFAFKNYGVSLQSDELTPTSGIKDCLNLLAYLFVDKGDLIISTTPGYNVFNKAATNYGGRVIEMRLEEDNDFLPDIVSYLKNNQLKPKIVHLNYPNNPTGRSCNFTYYQRLKEYVSSYNGLVINDAAYIDYSYMKPPVSLLSNGTKGSLELYSMSKTFGFTGARVGMIAGDKTYIKALDSIRDQFNSGSSKVFLRLYKELLLESTLTPQQNKYKRRYFVLKEVLKRLGFEVMDLDSTFYLFVKVPELLKPLGEDVFEITKKLRQDYGIAVIPYEIADKSYLRFSLGYKNEEDPHTLLTRLQPLENRR